MQATSDHFEGLGGGTLVDPTKDEIPLSDIDLSMRGITRWLNELGIYTRISCDGHGLRAPNVGLLTYPTRKHLKLLQTISPEGMEIITRGKEIQFECNSNKDLLLQLAERLYILTDASAMIRHEAEQFKTSLIELLNIPGESKDEQRTDNFYELNLEG